MKQLIVVTGPTATGKTDLAITLAKKFNGAIISADSRQIYTGMDIGTGKVHPEDTVEKHVGYWIVNGVSIYGFDLVDPQERFSAADFCVFARRKITQLWNEHKTPLLVGGTWHYILAALDSFETIGIPPNKPLRRALERLSVGRLQDRLKEEKGERWRRMNQSDRQNPRRLVRAIEIARARKDGKRRIRSSGESVDFNHKAVFIGLTAPREALYKKSDEWLDARLQNGMVEEVKRLHARGVSHDRFGEIGLEYRWVSRFLRGIGTKEDLIDRLRPAIHQYIRRQLSFMRKDSRIQWFDITQQGYYDRIIAYLKGKDDTHD